jgi:PAS domain S-box-containing protein
MSGLSTSPDRAAARLDPRLRATFEEIGRRAVCAAAERLNAPVAAIQVEPGHVAVTCKSGAPSDDSTFSGERALWTALTAHLWYTRLPVAVSDFMQARSFLGGVVPPEGLRACLATPLLASDGRFVGALVVADETVREWTQEEIEQLQAFASSVSLEVSDALFEARPSNGAGKARPEGRLDVAPFIAAASALVSSKAVRTASDRRDSEETIEALETAMEELQVSIEELQLAHEEVQAARFIVEAEREHYRELFECVPYPYLITDPEGVIREANEGAASLLGARRAFMVGKPLVVFVAEAARPAFRTRLRQLRGGGRTEWPLQVVPRDRDPKMMVCAASALRSRESGAERIYWLFRDVHEREDVASPQQRPTLETVDPDREAAQTNWQDFEALLERATLRNGVPVVLQLHDLIAGALHTGALQVGQRLPSIRSIADRFSVTPYAALQAYAALEAEGVVERRERSGVYVASIDWPRPSRLPETAEWLATVLTQACEHQVRLPQFPDLVRRWTGSIPVRCVCVESCTDSLAALTHELGNRFGVATSTLPVEELLGSDGSPRRTSALPPALHDAQMIVTTAFHASQLRPIAEALGKPLLVATANPEVVAAVEAHLAEQPLTVICTDPITGERLRNLKGGIHRDQIRVVLADEVESAALSPTEPVLLTLAARQRLNGVNLRLIAPPSPSFSLDFARKVASTLLRLNLDGGRA